MHIDSHWIIWIKKNRGKWEWGGLRNELKNKMRWYDCALDEILGYGEGMNVGWIMVSLSA